MSYLKEACERPTSCVNLWVPLATFVVLALTGSGTRADPCPSGHWGPTCEGLCHCALKTTVCSSTDGHCLDGGCSRGYTGAPSCQTKCPSGTFGLGCSMVCHCPPGDECNNVNGVCPSDKCQDGYDGAGCLIRLPIFSSPPNITSVTTHQALITWRPWSSTLDTGDPPVGEYHLQYKGNTFPWTTYDVITVTSLPEPASYSRLVTGLVALETYEFRVSLARSDDGKVGAPFPAPHSTSLKACNAPSKAVTNLSAVQELEGTDKVRITLNWKAPESSTSGCTSLTSHQVAVQCEGNTCTTTVTLVSMPQQTYTFSGLSSHTTKQLQVTPVNDAGQLGPSASLVAMALTTPTAAPTTPAAVFSTSATESNTVGLGQGVISLSTTESSMELTWPDVGASKYEIVLMINDSYSVAGLKGQIQQQITLAGTYLLVHSLHAATRYNVTVSPNTGGAAVHLLAWTNPLQPPAPPNPAVLRVTSQSATIYIKPLKITTGPLTAYQVIMEYTSLPLAQQAQSGRVRRKRTLVEVDEDRFQNVKGYDGSKQDGLDYYMTAELTGSAIGAGINFTIGDGREYNGYLNAPLQEKTTYTVWIGLISTLAGMTKRTFVNVQGNTVDGSTFSTPATSPEVQAAAASANVSNIGLAIGLFFLFLVLIIAGFIIFCAWSRGWENVCPSYLLDCWANYRMVRQRRINRNRDRLFDLFQSEQKPGLNTKSDGNVFKRSGPISTDDFVKDYEISGQYKKNNLTTEFQKLPRGLTSTAYVGTSVQNLHLNRNVQTVAYDTNRLHMVTQTKGENDYINATLIRGTNEKSYIITQSPLPITISHFWRVVWDYRICHVVMLFDLEEQGSVTMPKYWPPKEGQSRMYGQVEVKLVKEEKYAFYNVRSFELKLDSQNEVRYVRQFQYTDWQPTTQIPNGVLPFLDFIQRCQRNSDTADISLVHCQSGGGRSGLFVAIESLLEQAKQSGQLDILTCVTRLCMERPGLMKFLSQYHFIHQTLFHALSYKNSVVSRKDFTAYLDNLNYVAVGNKTCMQLEFEKMLRLTPISPNEDEDRFQSPAIIQQSSKGSSSNSGFAVTLIDSYKQKGYYILMDHPSESKVSSFWRNVHTLACSCIVRLSDPDDSFYQFIPDAGLEKQYGNLIVHHDFSINHSELLVERSITLKHATKKENSSPMTVIVFHLYWMDNKSSPNVRAMLDLWRRVRFLTQRKTGRVAVVSGHTFSRSGLFCSASVLLDKMEREGEANVYQFIKQLRTEVPEAVSNLEQYKFCYRVIKEYLRQTEQTLNTSHNLSVTIPTHPFKSPYQMHTSTPKHRSPAKTPGQHPYSGNERVATENTPGGQYPLLNVNSFITGDLRVDMGDAPVTRSPARSRYRELPQPTSSSSSVKSLRGSGEEPTLILDSPVKQQQQNTSCNDSPMKLYCNDLSAEMDLSSVSRENHWQEVLRDAARLRNDKAAEQSDEMFVPVSKRIQRESLLHDEEKVDTPKAWTLPSPSKNPIAAEEPTRRTLDTSALPQQGQNSSPKKLRPNASKAKENSPSKRRKARLEQIGRALPHVGGYN